ncbi:alternative ribosome rescue aminoacyl-tRNA hydrolase ArfB [Adhaeretor mobilis]|uniref:Peptidyl-tRNA hydrolase ArfB n=1 Tax=Adhaeretor mobilis TaxID=1930276 RepID=A0A517MY71_9BACT|nr:alternative ribosome rescue aminoacyl-tRNA hydrolase ArfB [Adhaeretor mobilis]QDS99830.1 Peptidyl-tRNA hydrolase ArfB [Adhaeretor mobilis]
MARALLIDPDTTIPAEEMMLSFARSSGPGGQNVNKVNTKAVLRWNVAATDAITETVKKRFLKQYANRVNQAGELVLASDIHREQIRNIAACYDKLRQLLLPVLHPPKRRRSTRPTRGSVERRIAEKKRRSDQKKQRRFRPE